MKRLLPIITVWVGRNPGVYFGWEMAKKEVVDFVGAIYKDYATIKEAQEAYKKLYKKELADCIAGKYKLDAVYKPPITDSLAVSVYAVWEKCGYRITDVDTNDILLEEGPFKGGSANVAGYIALRKAIEMSLNVEGHRHKVIYINNKFLFEWLSTGVCTSNAYMDEILEHKVKETDAYLQRLIKEKHPVLNKVRKWKTSLWGPIPNKCEVE